MLKVQNLTKTYENGVTALKGVSFDTPSCGMIAIIGSSGCGKSTLLNVLSGIDDRSSGEIYFDGVLCDPKEVKSAFATVYQDYKLIENVSTIDNILIAKELSVSNYSQEQIEDLLVELGISECRDEKVMNLSGGQKQRVAIARAMVQNPRVIFADEPTGNLDSANSENTFGILKQLSKKILIIVVSHDVETISKYADRVIKLQDGQIVSDSLMTSGNVEPVRAEDRAKKEDKRKGGLSFHRATTLAIAFNKSKIGRRVAFMTIAILLVMIMMICCNWALMDYETMVTATYNKSNASNMVISSYTVQESFDAGENIVTVSMHKDLAALQEYLSNEKGIDSAKVYNRSMAKQIYNLPQDFYGRQIVDINGKNLTLREFAYGGALDNYIATDDPESLGLKMLEGRAPKEIGEVAIPKSKQLYFNALGGYRDPVTNEEVYMSPEQLIGYDFYGVKIVGVFEDGVNIPDKYDNYQVGVNDEENRVLREEAESYVSENILANSIIFPTVWSDVWDASWYMYGPSIAKVSQGQYIHTSMVAGKTRYDNVGVAPANDLTAHITGINTVSQGNILVSKAAAMRYNLKDGDIVQLSTSVVRGEISETSLGYIEDEVLQKAIKFNVIVDNGANLASWDVLYNENDYAMMMGDTEGSPRQIVYSFAGLSTANVKEISKFARQTYGDGDDKNMPARLEYVIDNGSNIMNSYYTMDMIRSYVMIAVSVILAIILGVLLYNTISILITSKANELLILKSLGASKFDYLKIYGIFTMIQLVIEIVIGVSVGIGGIFLLNNFILGLLNAGAIVILPLMPIAIVLTIVLVAVVSIVSLIFNISNISDKNLRKAFQKIKE